MSVYQVTGQSEFVGFRPGQIFEATLEPVFELRAIRRGNIVVLEESKVALRAGSYRLGSRG